MRVLLVDDERLARLELRRLLLEHPEIEVAGEARNGAVLLMHGMDLMIGGEQLCSGGAVRHGVIIGQPWRRDKTGTREILIARTSRLTVPELLVLYFSGGEFGYAGQPEAFAQKLREVLG